jgi:hypothetical protein
MTQRIAIETPNGTVYLGEDCEAETLGKWELLHLSNIFADQNGTPFVGHYGRAQCFFLSQIRPIQPKKMRPMDKSELVQLVMKGAEFYMDCTKTGGTAFPEIYGEEKDPIIAGWSLEKYSHYTLPGDPTERKLEVEK